MFFRRRKNKIFALRSRSEVPESAALRPGDSVQYIIRSAKNVFSQAQK
ncbi:Uncharacterized protein dnm_097600 [Desulfonema magnum]|uniref:Uncharacterized protein n=1 Tax=Desulfonema magnum TaxID=45655 RepID=A0A975GU22_9BACT|nr:Uncharacterized protein dnm_097600 [Desulfonema magnum]